MMESRNLLQAASPPVGFGPSSAVVLEGLRELRPPLSVVAAAALMSLAPLTLLVGAVSIGWNIITGDAKWLGRILILILGFGIPFMLSALSYRGIKRALHYGDYSQGFFIARLVAVLCLIIGVFLVWYVVLEGEPAELSMVVPFITLAVVWLPMIPLQARSAKEWPERVSLRRGLEVRSEAEANIVLDVRPLDCGHLLRPAARQLVPVEDASGRGWVLNVPCPTCGQPANWVFRHRIEDAPDPLNPLALGAPGSQTSVLRVGEMVALAGVNQVPPDTDFTSVPLDELRMMYINSVVAIELTEELLVWARSGHMGGRSDEAERIDPPPPPRPEAVDNWVTETELPTLKWRLAERRQTLARIEQESARRGVSGSTPG